MASINTIVKRKQYLWLGIVVVGAASAIGGALYLSDVDMSGNGEAVAEQEPVPDMTGVVDTTFDDKVRQHATTEMQVTAAQMQKQYEEIRRELDVLNKQRGDDQRRIEKLGQDNAALAEQVKALGANPVTATGEPVPQTPASPPGPEGEPQPGNTPVSFPPQGSVAVPPPTAFYPGNGVTPPPQVTYQSVPVPNRIQRKVFTLIGDSYSYFYGSSKSASQIIRQNVTINALKEGITSYAARNGDSASLVNLATTSSMEKQRLAHVSIGHVAMSEDLSQQFAQYVMKHAPQDAEAILTNTSSPEIAERRRAMAWSFVQEQVQPGVDNAWRESRGDIGKGMESVPSGGGSQDIIADHQGHQAIIDQRTQDSNIRNDVKHQVDNMVTEYKGNIGDTQNSIHGEENIVDRQYSELKNNHKQEEIQQNNRYNEENKRQKLMPTPSEDALKQMVDDKKERLKGPL